MSLIDEELKQALQDMEADQSGKNADGQETPPQVKIGGLFWPCSTGTKKIGRVHAVGGYTFTYDFAVNVRTDAVSGESVFSSIVDALKPGKTKVEFDGDELRAEFITHGLGAFVTLYLIDPNR